MNERTLEDCVALVTGAARGLGAAVGASLGAAGARIVVADVREQAAHATAAALRDAGIEAWAVHLDVADEPSVRRAVERALERYGRIDALVNSAGIDVSLAADELSVEDWDRVVGVNLRGPFLLAREVLPRMREAGGGQIVNVVSTAAKRAWPNASAYHASKWGLLGLSHALHVEGRAYGVRVCAVVAGGMRTPFLLERFDHLDPAALLDPATVADVVRFVLSMPIGSAVPEVMVLPIEETSWP